MPANDLLGPLSARSVPDLLRIVDDVWLSWTDSAAGMAEIWFRGQTDAYWPLLPTHYRKPFAEVSEHRYRHEFGLRARPFLDEATTLPTSDWDWYFLMQHYSIPTRLLDWTESALAALYFALLPTSSNQPACIWLLEPGKLNALNPLIDEDSVQIYSDVRVAPYLPQLWDEDRPIPAPPVAIDPPHNSRRITAQRGKFVVHGSSIAPLNEIGLERYLVRIEIPSEAKPTLRRQLLTAGVFESVLFPGLQGLGREIRDLWSIEISAE